MIKKITHIIHEILARYFYRKIVKISPNEKYVSFTFDDVPSSGFKNGIDVLNNVNLKGTFYVSLGLLDTVYTKSELDYCFESGHELGCHTFEHKNLETLSKVEIEYQLTQNQKSIKEIGINHFFKNFSFPFGGKSLKSKKIAASRFKTCRGIQQGINIGKVDFNNLQTIRLYEKSNSIERLEEILDEFNSKGGWLIFYTHDIQENFSKYGCSKEYFTSVVHRCLQKNYKIHTIKEMVDKWS